MPGKPRKAARFVVKGHSFGIKPGIDPDRMNQLLDELEAVEVTRESVASKDRSGKNPLGTRDRKSRK